MSAPALEHFLCTYDQVLARIDEIDPKAYDRSRNYLHGAVTWLGPFLSHGVIDTVTVARRILDRHSQGSAFRLLYELAWREYFHREWQRRGQGIFRDIRHPQEDVLTEDPPAAILEARTGIDAIDTALGHFLNHGTLHNHARMWIASLTCNIAHTYWPAPARWMYYHLLDGDLASNTLNWQWIAGTFSHRRYLANQDTIDKFSGSRQSGSWLDVPYDELTTLALPACLAARRAPVLLSDPPGDTLPPLSGRLALRSIWHLDPLWQRAADRQIVFIDRDQDQRWPLSPDRWRFVEHFTAALGASLYVGTCAELTAATRDADIIRQEYPACCDWPGIAEPRRWLYPLPTKRYRSFSQFWKQVCRSVDV